MNFSSKGICVGTLLLTFALPGSLAAAEQILRAGAAQSDITPPLGETVVGSFAPFPATTVHDRLFARSLVLDNGDTQIAFVVCDSLGISRDIFDQARHLISQETDFPVANILMAATHTHSATRSASTKYRDQLARGIADALVKALHNLQPAQIGWGSVDEPSQVFNRRWYVTDPELRKNPFGGVDQVRMNPPRGHEALLRPAGPTDPEISFLTVRTTTGGPIALLANYSLHYVGGVNKGDISADYFGIFDRRIPQLLAGNSTDPPMIAILTNGTSGDINNINFRSQSPRRAPYEKMAEVADLVAHRVAEAHQGVTFCDWLPLGSAHRELTLRFRKPDSSMQSYFADVLARPEDTPAYHRHERTYAQRVQDLLEGPDDVVIPLQAVRIGELSIAAIPFEVFAEIGLEIKNRSPFKDTFTIELANDSYGYLPTPRQHELGGYETWMGTNRVQLDASEQITRAVLEMMQELKAAH